MSDVIFNVVLFVVLLPALASGAVLRDAHRPWRGEEHPVSCWGSALGLGLVYLAAHLQSGGGWVGLLYLVPGIVVLGLVQPVARRLGPWAGAGLGGILALLGGYLAVRFGAGTPKAMLYLVIGAAALGVLQPLFRRIDPHWGGTIGVGAGYLTAHFGTSAQPEIMPYLLVLLGMIGLAQPGLHTLGAGARWIFRLAIPYVVVLAAIGFKFRNGEGYWSGLEAVLWMNLLVLSIAAADWAFDELAERHPGATVPLSMIVLAMGGSIVLVQIAVASTAELMGVLAAVGGGALVVSWLQPNLTLARGGTALFTWIFAGLFLYGFFLSYDDPSPWTGLTVAIAPQMAWLGCFGPLKELDGWVGAIVRAGLFVPPLGIAILLATV